MNIKNAMSNIKTKTSNTAASISARLPKAKPAAKKSRGLEVNVSWNGNTILGVKAKTAANVLKAARKAKK